MEQIYKEFSFIESWFRSGIEWITNFAQSVSDWVGNHPGTMALCALGFLVLIFWIGSRYVIMPKDREGSD